MTEAEWLAATDPSPMTVALLDWQKASGRKFRLFACACCWRISRQFLLDYHGDALQAAEMFARGFIDVEELRLRRVEYHAQRHPAQPTRQPVAAATHPRRVDAAAAACAADAVANPEPDPARRAVVRTAEQKVQAELLREIFGNPFRPVTADPSWRTSTAVALAQGIYDERAFDRMPILADALQDAGCEDEAVLSHCRDPKGTHVRGCWVVDLVLGKT